jgi:putative acetyltransferase
MNSSHFDLFPIRPASNEDLAAIKNVVFTVLQEYGLVPNDHGKDEDLDDIEKNYFSNNGFFGLVENQHNSEIIGTFGLMAINKNSCELRKMYLLKPFRGQGLGKFMLETAMVMARQFGYQKITLETISPLKEAIALYKKYGFKEIEPEEINDRVDQAFELILDFRFKI